MSKKEITELYTILMKASGGNLDLVAHKEGNYTLQARGLVKRYGKRTVVNDVNFNVTQGEIVGLLGPNGAGKTTSFYMTTGLVLPNAGRVYVVDEDKAEGAEDRVKEITDYPVYKRAHTDVGIGYLAQEASVFRKMSVEDNIFSVLEMRKLKKSISPKTIDMLTEKYDLPEYQEQLSRFPRPADFSEYDWKRLMMEDLIHEFRLNKVRKNLGDRLSGGERRRCEIARCVAISPRFIMLDEPFAGVDPIAVEDIQFIVYDLKKRNIGILITDHNVQETLCITDRAYLLFEGRILFEGIPEELAANKIVRENYLSNSFVLKKKDFEAMEEERRKKDTEETT
jgi:lipopolysaccharide export system ATP-binding protein